MQNSLFAATIPSDGNARPIRFRDGALVGIPSTTQPGSYRRGGRERDGLLAMNIAVKSPSE